MRLATIFAVGGACAAALLSSTAGAQEVSAQAQVTTPAAAAPTPAPAAAPAPAPAPTVRAEVKVEDDSPDHDRFIGRFAVGYFGISQLPLGTGGVPGDLPNANAVPATATAPTGTTINAPIVGVRYWFQRNIGVDAGLGFGTSSGSTENVQNITGGGQASVSTDHVSTFGFALHGGVPIAFAYGHHYTFELIPEATLGIASGTIKAAAAQNGATQTPDTSLSGFRLDVGARVGAEIHFGFIGVPELALQGSIGLYVRRESIKVSQGNNSASDGTTTITTSVGSDPWALFVNNISALYYF